MRIKTLREAVSSEEVSQVAQEIMDLSNNTRIIKGSYGAFDFRRYQEALEFAKVISKNKKLMARIKPIYDEVYDYLENWNFHAENLSLDYLFNRKQFNKMLEYESDSIFKYA